jgi:hypothetical protein
MLRGLIGDGILPTSASLLLALASGALTAQQPAAGTGRATGVVFDSIAGVPLANVMVQFVGTDLSLADRMHSAHSDATGRYELVGLTPGDYMAGFYHQTMDTLGIELGPRLVTIREGTQTIPLATPSPKTLMDRICPPTPASEATGLLLGHVRSAIDETAVDGAFVVAEWNELVIDEGGIRHRDARVHGATTGPGWFAICYVPTDAILLTRAGFGADSSGWVAVQVPPDGLRHVTYLIGPVTRVARRTADDSDTTAQRLGELRGGARISGTVRDAEGRPVHNAHVVVWETGREAVTNENGVFSIDSLPDGTHMMEARTLGYVPVYLPVHLVEHRPATTELVFEERAVLLPAVNTRASLVYSSHLAGFERRRRSGFGEFLTPAQLEAKPEMRLGRLLQEMQGLELQERNGQTMPRMRSSRGGGSRTCEPSLYVDGLLDRSGDLDLLFTSRIAAIEVYNREFSRPAQFADKNQCGAIVVWMRPISPQQRRVNR